MVYRNLRDFLARLDELGELHRIQALVDPILEIAAVTAQVCRMPGNGPALYFGQVQASSIPVVTNLFGSARRMALALGLDSLEGLPSLTRVLLGNLAGCTALEKLQSLNLSESWRAAAAVELGESTCLESTVEFFDLEQLPIPKGWPEDGDPDHAGRFLTLPLVVTRGLESGQVNCGMYRVALLGSNRLAVHWSNTSGAAAHAAEWQARGEAMPIVIAVGGPPALTFAATLPLPPFLDEFTFAGLLQGEPVDVVRSKNGGLPIPAAAELVIEGFVDPGALVRDGAFGNHTGYYVPSVEMPLVQVTSVSRRKDMILPATVVGPPPMEDCWLATAGGMLMLPLLQVDVPSVVGMYQPFAGIFHGAAIVALDMTIAGDGHELLTRLWETPWFAKARLLVLVDAEQNPADVAGVCWRVMNNVEWARDLLIDGNRFGIDATRKPDDARVALQMDAETVRLVERRWREYGFDDVK